MKKNRGLILLLIGLVCCTAWADTKQTDGLIDDLLWLSKCDMASNLTTTTCEECKEHFDWADYYCDCKLAPDLIYGIDTILNSETWFKVTAGDLLNNGLTTYWFSDDSVELDLFFTCQDETPVKSFVVPGNRAKMLDPAAVQEMVGNYGNLVSGYKAGLRARPLHNGSGRMLLFKYGEGFDSSCDDMLPLVNKMYYAISHEDNVFALSPDDMANRDMFVRWVEPYNQKAEMWLTIADCEGDKVGSEVVSDSMRVYYITAQTLKTAKQNNQTIYLHHKVGAGVKGQLRMVNRVKWDEEVTHDETVCYGGFYELNSNKIIEAGQYTDTLFVVNDTLVKHLYNISFAEEPVVKVNLKLTDSSVKYKSWTFTKEGDYEREATAKTTLCKTKYLIHIEKSQATEDENKGNNEENGKEEPNISTDITNVASESEAEWWTVMGMKLSGVPTERGMYIRKDINGVRKVIIR